MIEDYINNLKVYDNFSFSIEDKIRDLFGEVCFYNGSGKGGSMENKISPLKYKSPLHPKNVDPKNKEQVERCIREEVAYAQMLETSATTSPFTSPLVQRTHREP